MAKYYHTIFGESSACEKIIDEMVPQGWRVHTQDFLTMNQVAVPVEGQEGADEVVLIPCFSYLLEHQSVHTQEQVAPLPPPRKFIGMPVK